MERYPYFIYPLLSELENCKDPARISQLKNRIAANVGSIPVLISLIGEYDPDLKNFYPAETAAASSTDATIDAFIARFSRPDEKLPDILTFSETQPPVPEPLPEPETEPADVMAKVKLLVKNHEYEEALAIMNHFYLNNPKKSIYFADQIRFIKKMMLNDSKKSINS